MNKTPDRKKVREGTDRRGFLKLAGLGGIAGGAAMVAGGEAEAAEKQTSGRGYRETDHVRKYYELAKF